MAATATKPSDATWTDADKKWGYKFGCEGLRSVEGAADFLDKSRATVYRLVNEEKIRKGKDGNICFRSLQDHAHSLEE